MQLQLTIKNSRITIVVAFESSCPRPELVQALLPAEFDDETPFLDL